MPSAAVRDGVPAPESHLPGLGRRMKVVWVAVENPADLTAWARLLFQHHELLVTLRASSTASEIQNDRGRCRGRAKITNPEFRVGIVGNEVDGLLHESVQIHVCHILEGVVGDELVRRDPLDNRILHGPKPNRHVGCEPIKI